MWKFLVEHRYVGAARPSKQASPVFRLLPAHTHDGEGQQVVVVALLLCSLQVKADVEFNINLYLRFNDD